MIDAITGAQSFSDALSGILKKLADMVLNSAFDALFNGATGSGGWLTGLFKGFDDGGYTGPGPKKQPKGVVHAGEVVWSQDDIRRAGGVAAVEAMRKGIVAFGGNGPAIMAPVMPTIQPAAAAGNIVVNFNPVIDNRGASVEAVARTQQQLDKLKAELPSRVTDAVRKAQKSNVKLN